MAAIELDSVAFSYSDRRALESVSFSVDGGRISALLGPNGGGKTTLFHILSTVLRPDSGTAKVLGLNVALNPYQVRRHLGVVFQNRSLDLELSVEENLRHQGHLYGLRGRLLDRQVEDALLRLGLADRRHDRVKGLSGGLQRRADLAKSVLHKPQVLLLDEPTNGLDPEASLNFWKLLRDLNTTEKMTILLTTHSMEEADRCDYLVILSDGRVVSQGTPEDLKRKIRREVVVIRSPSVESLNSEIQDRFHLDSRIVNGLIRIEHGNGHRLVAELMECFPKAIESVTVSLANLEDVFIHETGKQFNTTTINGD